MATNHDQVLNLTFTKTVTMVDYLVQCLQKGRLCIITEIDLDNASQLVKSLTSKLNLHHSLDHHFKNLGYPFRKSINDVFIEVSETNARSIFFHNENAYSQKSPELLYLYCINNSPFGGENIFMKNEYLDLPQYLNSVYSNLYAKRFYYYESIAAIEKIMSESVNFSAKGIANIKQYIDYLQVSPIDCKISKTQTTILYKTSLLKRSCIDGNEYLQLPSDGSCSLSYHNEAFCNHHNIFYNPMFGKLLPCKQYGETQYYSDKEGKKRIFLDDLFNNALIRAYTHAIPIKSRKQSLIICNNKSWLHSVNAPGKPREMCVNYSYAK